MGRLGVLGPTCHLTDDKIRLHAFYCMLRVSLVQYLRSGRGCPSSS